MQDQIQRLIVEGKYSLAQEFILIAIQNQLYLEQQDSATISPKQEDLSDTERGQFANSDYLRVSDGEIPTVGEPSSKVLNISEPLWGLANRIFPLKITLRVLSNMLRSDCDTVQREELIKRAFSAAREIGIILAKADKKHIRKRGEKLSDALPRNLKDESSLARFSSQFVGGVVYSTNKLFGAPANLKFVNIVLDPAGNARIGITKKGLDFARMRNPVLDDQNYEDVSLSQEETRFLIEHIFESIPAETKGIMLILSEISEGRTSPNDFVPILKRVFGYSDDTKATTIKGGLVGRMVELGLIERDKVGVRVSFELTITGESIFKRYSGHFLEQGVVA